MTTNEVLKLVAEKTNCSQKDVKEILGSYAEVVTETLSENHDEKVPMVGGLATFSVKHVPERHGITQMGENKGSAWIKEAHDELSVKIPKSKRSL